MLLAGQLQLLRNNARLDGLIVGPQNVCENDGLEFAGRFGGFFYDFSLFGIIVII